MAAENARAVTYFRNLSVGSHDRRSVVAVKPKLLGERSEAVRSGHYSRRSEQSHCLWAKRFIFFHSVRHPAHMAEPEIKAFLTHLVVKEMVRASTENQTLSAPLFLCGDILGPEIGELGEIVRPRRAERLPVVVTGEEVKAVLGQLKGAKWLMPFLMDGGRLRLMEYLGLRVQNIDFARRKITGCRRKREKERATLLTESLKKPLKDHLRKVKAMQEKDLRDDWGLDLPPDALDQEYPDGSTESLRQWLFPQEDRWTNHKTWQQERHQVHESVVQNAVGKAARDAGLTKPATCYSLCDRLATHLSADGNDIRTVQEFLGHKDVKATIIYTNVLNWGEKGVRSTVDTFSSGAAGCDTETENLKRTGEDRGGWREGWQKRT